jgi:hypothetical protein
MPTCSTVKVGVWEADAFIGAVIFSHGASKEIALPFRMTQFEVVELTRVALTTHITPVTRIIAIALRMLKSQSPGVRIVISYADSSHGHVGGIYQGGNWIYAGARTTPIYFIKGERLQGKTVTHRYGNARMGQIQHNVDASARRTHVIKHRYFMPMDDDARKICETFKQPYPKRHKHAMVDDQSTQRRGSTDRAAPFTSTEDTHHEHITTN